MFHGGLKEAVEHCRKIYKDKGGREIAYQEVDAVAEELFAKDLPYDPN